MNNPLVSVIIPTKNSSKNLEASLISIKEQSYKNIELIVVIPEENLEFKKASQKYNFKLINCNQGKNAARNIGASNSQGEYLFHIDDDMRLSKEVISECVVLVSTGNFKAVVIPEIEEKSSGFYSKVRVLEKMIASSDACIEAPRFIAKDIFNKLGQIDVRLDPIDEGDLKAKLEEHNFCYITTKANIILSPNNRMSSLRGRWVYMYDRGQKMPLFNLLHPNSNQLKPMKRVKPYLQQSMLLLNKNIIGLSLLMIKAVDLIVLKSGSRHISVEDKKIISDFKNKNIFEEEAGTYQKVFFENTLGARYIDKREKEIVNKYLENFDKNSHIKILDIGPGGGRWSELLLGHFPNSEVYACDLSNGMVRGLNEKFKNEPRFNGRVGDMQSLPFEDGLFDLVISIRAIKYATNQKKVFDEIYRVLKPTGMAVIELPYLNFIYRIVRKFKLFGKIGEYANRITLLDQRHIKLILEEVRFKIYNLDNFFSVPATFYKNCKSSLHLSVLNIVDQILPKNIFGRSMFICIKKNNSIKVGINSRIYQQTGTGIPYFIKCLYEKLIEDKTYLSFIFFQTNLSKSIGVTKLFKSPNNGLFAALFDLFLVIFLIKKEKIDIFHGPSSILPFFRVKGVKYILTIHDLSFLIFPENHSVFFKIYYKYGIKRSLRNADCIVADSENTKEDIVRFYNVPEEKIRVVYLGVNELFLKEIKNERVIKEDYFFSLTTHPKRKNIISVLEVMSKNNEIKKYKYVIAGLIGANQLVELKDKILKLGLIDNVVVLGYVDEVQLVNLYKNAKFLIYPSFYEGFGFPVLEAMICKCPIITSNNSSLKEITPNSNWLVDPHSLDDISDKIMKMIKLGERERVELINNNYNFSRHFTWSKTVSEYHKLFEYLKYSNKKFDNEEKNTNK
jgi:glycosyltransferase involved in cell wall biosynthesis